MGLPKTATTSFQNAVFANRERLLKDYGILYPSVSANHTNTLCTIFHDDPRKHITVKMMGKLTIDEAEAVRRQNQEKFERCIEDVGDWNTLVLSAEGLSNLNAAELAELKNWTKKYVEGWKILFWSRHPISYTISNMQQMVRGGHTIENMLTKLPLPNFKGRIGNNILTFGKEAIELKAFEEARSEDGGVVAAFCRQIGIDDKVAVEIANSAITENESMSHIATSLISSLNRQRPLLVNGALSPGRTTHDANLIATIRGDKFNLPADVKRNMKTLARPDVAWLNTSFGTKLYLDVFEDNDDDGDEEFNKAFPSATIDSLALLLANLIQKTMSANGSSQL